MTLNAIYDKKDDIPAGFEELYSEKNGKFELTGVTGIKTQADVDRVQGSLNAERTAHKTTKDRLRKVTFNGQSVVEMNDDQLNDFVTKMDAYDELVASSGQVDEGKIAAIVEGRIKQKLAPVERERDQLKAQLTTATEEITGFKAKDKQRAIHDKVREAAATAKVLPSALEDALMLAERVFDVDENGNVAVKDQVGYTPGIAPDVWFTEIQSKREHWWEPSVGGGARGGKGSNGTGSNPWSAAHWNLTEQGRIVREQGAEKAGQLAKSAGSFVGAASPAK
jgi:hypothetical protein